MYANTNMPTHNTVLDSVVALTCVPMCNQVETPAQHHKFIEKYGVARSIKRRLKQEIQDNSGALDGAQGGAHDLTKARSGITIAFSKHRDGTHTSVEDKAINSYQLRMARTYAKPVQSLYVAIYGEILDARAATKIAWTSTKQNAKSGLEQVFDQVSSNDETLDG